MAPVMVDDAFIYGVNKIINGINYDSAAQTLLQKYDVLKRADNQQHYIYKNGVYKSNGWEQLERALYETYGGFTKNNGQSVIDQKTVSEILTRVFAMRTVDSSELYDPKHFLNVRNGMLDFDSRNLAKHSPEFHSFTQIDTDYDKDADCPNLLNFLEETLEPKYIKTFQELAGYVLWPEYNIHKAFMFLGPKRTGKSTLLNVLTRLIGKNNINNASLQKLVGDRFALANLFGKFANICGDLPRKIVEDPGTFKNITGGDYVQGEQKFKTEFGFLNTAKLIFSTNDLPALKYEDPVYYSRWIIIPFDNSVFGREDSYLIDRLTTDSELSGLLNWALDGLDRLKDNGWQFSYSDDSIAIYQRKSNPVIAFLEDCCEECPEGYTTKTDLINAYNKWAKTQGIPPAKSKKSFGSIIADQSIIPVDDFRASINGDRPEAWRGIRLVG